MLQLEGSGVLKRKVWITEIKLQLLRNYWLLDNKTGWEHFQGLHINLGPLGVSQWIDSINLKISNHIEHWIFSKNFHNSINHSNTNPPSNPPPPPHTPPSTPSTLLPDEFGPKSIRTDLHLQHKNTPEGPRLDLTSCSMDGWKTCV